MPSHYTQQQSQECLDGQIPIHVDDTGAPHAKVPRPKISGEKIDDSTLSDLLGTSRVSDPLMIDVGPIWLVTLLDSYDALYGLKVNMNKLYDFSREINATGVTIYAVHNTAEIHVRSFAPLEGVPEDPVCGSGNAAVGAHIKATGLHEKVGLRYTAYQGAAMGRDGQINVRIEGDDVYIGGTAVTIIDGNINI